MSYSLRRDPDLLRRVTETDLPKGVGYVYEVFRDRVDVYKFSLAEVTQAALFGEGPAELLRVSAPRYRVTSGECTCDGYQFRQSCRHAEKVEAILHAGE